MAEQITEFTEARRAGGPREVPVGRSMDERREVVHPSRWGLRDQAIVDDGAFIRKHALRVGLLVEFTSTTTWAASSSSFASATTSSRRRPKAAAALKVSPRRKVDAPRRGEIGVEVERESAGVADGGRSSACCPRGRPPLKATQKTSNSSGTVDPH